MRIISARAHNLQLHASATSLHQPRPMSSMGTAQGYINRVYPNKLYGHYANGGVEQVWALEIMGMTHVSMAVRGLRLTTSSRTRVEVMVSWVMAMRTWMG